LPTHLAERYLQARNDPQLTSLTDQIAVHEARYHELLATLDTGELGRAWVDANRAWEAFGTARSLGDVPAMDVALAELGKQLAHGNHHRLLWEDITEQSKHLKDLRQAEHRRLVDLDMMIKQQDALLLFGLLLHTVREAIVAHISDRTLARAVLTAIQTGVDDMEQRDLPPHGELSHHLRTLKPVRRLRANPDAV